MAGREGRQYRSALLVDGGSRDETKMPYEHHCLDNEERTERSSHRPHFDNLHDLSIILPRVEQSSNSWADFVASCGHETTVDKDPVCRPIDQRVHTY